MVCTGFFISNNFLFQTKRSPFIMIDISVNDLNKYYGSNHVIRGVSFDINSGEKVGLLGRNGSGKTTLFRVITGDEHYESGNIAKAAGRKAEMLAQIPVFGAEDTAEDVLRSSFADINGVYNAMKKIEGDADPAALKRYGHLMEEYERLGGYETEVRLDKVCGGMNIDGRLRNSLFSRLSGGEKSRVNLARILLRECDILLLDEPTNHLDLDSLEWLEGFLKSYPGTVLTVSHDRVFLDRVVTRIIELEGGKANFYTGGYSYYIEEKRRRYIYQSEQYERQQKEIKRIEDRAKWFVEQNRFTTKHHAILSRIDHMEKVERPISARKLTSEFDGGGHAAKEVVSLESVCKGFGEKCLLRDAGLKVLRHDRIALIGANGCGKSTLLKMIMGEEQPDSGEVKISSNIKIGYLPQIITFDDPGATVLDMLRVETGATEEKARAILARFNFMPPDVIKQVSVLSGGEKSRLRLCLMMQKNINFLLLDEPTNHLDIASREWIESALSDFDGTMLFVSHDRYFLRKFADKVWSMENGVIDQYDCGFDEYTELSRKKGALKLPDKMTGREKPVLKEKNKVLAKNTKPSPGKEQLEGMITEAESELSEIDSEMEAVSMLGDYLRANELNRAKNQLQARIDALYDKWLEADS
jgi:ATPase subunit of ABC transporter with duplicated ATPase domains